MTRRDMATVVVAASVLVVGSVWVRAQQAPARDRSTPAPAVVGTASIAGVVTTASEPAQPLRHVAVTLQMGTLTVPRAAVSDDQGRFIFTDLPAGNYTVGAQKPAWVVADVRPRPAGLPTGVPVSVDEGQALTDVRIRLTKGGVIAGTVRFPGGTAAAQVMVQALMVTDVGGVRSTTMGPTLVQTDDLGRFRLFGLNPGRYAVHVQPLGNMGAQATMRQVLPSEVRWAEGGLVPVGMPPGTAPPNLAPAPELGPTVMFSRTYYPGTAHLADAALIEVQAGSERLNVDFDVQMVPTATVSGSVARPDGTPAAGAQVSLTLPAQQGQEDLIAQIVGAAQSVTRPDGTFVINSVAPGNYELLVRSAPAQAGGRGARPAMAAMPLAATMMFGGGPSSQTLWAREPISVNGQPVGPIGLQLREGLTMQGRVVFEGPPPDNLSAIRVTVSTPSAMLAGLPNLPMMRMNPSVGVVKDDGTFEVAGLMPGHYALSVAMPGYRLLPTEPGTGWMIKSARVGDVDLADVGVDLRGGDDIAGVELTLTNQPSELSGRVLDAAGTPVTTFPLVVFSADRAYWGATGRRVHALQPAADGGFLIAGLPAGQYYLAAVTEVDPRELQSATFLESLIPGAIGVTLADGERKTQDVRVQGGGRPIPVW
jgi:hypothetical protein